ncbi:MAG TPA: N-acetylmuramoyl-L-alanine amidase-like domain-containing protein [Longimicrobium sp.]|nr:N-acetylmuramoyl-L-alanine amidase-like domain-containing protein [Longimicrobium sp.]
MPQSRRRFLRNLGLSAAALMLPDRLDAAAPLAAGPTTADRERLAAWLRTLRREGLPPRGGLGRAIGRVGQLALDTPYRAHTLEEYLVAGGAPRAEPATCYLTVFDCVTLVESAQGVARTAAKPNGGWNDFVHEIERMRYRGGVREGYTSRLHYFSEWITDNARRGLVRDLGPELGAVDDARPLRFMSTHRGAYPALSDDATHDAIVQMEKRLDAHPRHLVPTERIPGVMDRIHTGDVLAFATSVEGLDASHTGLAYRDRAGVLRVLHAPLSGGAVTISRGDLHAYVAGIRRSTGVMVARPLQARPEQ